MSGAIERLAACVAALCMPAIPPVPVISMGKRKAPPPRKECACLMCVQHRTGYKGPTGRMNTRAYDPTGHECRFKYTKEAPEIIQRRAIPKRSSKRAQGSRAHERMVKSRKAKADSVRMAWEAKAQGDDRIVAEHMLQDARDAAVRAVKSTGGQRKARRRVPKAFKHEWNTVPVATPGKGAYSKEPLAQNDLHMRASYERNNK